MSFSTFKFTITHTRLKLHDDKREKSTEKESVDDEGDDDNETGTYRTKNVFFFVGHCIFY